MNDSIPLTAGALPHRGWPSRRTVWRWHFYAGLFCIPFVLWLSVTGTIYLFKPQIDAWLDRPFENLAIDGQPATAAAQLNAALAAVPGSALNAYELPVNGNAAVRILLNQGSDLIRVYVHPQTLEILKVINEDDRFTQMIFYLHGELMLGDRGSITIELAASWVIVMLLSGLFLWWPRGRRLAGIVYPRLHEGKRVLLRDLHAVAGLYVSALALCLLISGLPWAKSWGGLLSEGRQLFSVAAVRPDWSTSSEADRNARALESQPLSDEHAGHPMGAAGSKMPGLDYRVIEPMIANVAALKLLPPMLISPPSSKSPHWTARSDTQNRPQRANLVLDTQTGAILSRTDFSQRPLIDRLVGYGVAAHEGQLFGWFNQALGVFTTSSLILVSISAILMWWRRRTVGTLGAPTAQGSSRLAVSFFVMIGLLGVLLPLLGLSMLGVWLSERLILRRIPAARSFLGLPPMVTPR